MDDEINLQVKKKKIPSKKKQPEGEQKISFKANKN
jgi:hypothetical protein